MRAFIHDAVLAVYRLLSAGFSPYFLLLFFIFVVAGSLSNRGNFLVFNLGPPP